MKHDKIVRTFTLLALPALLVMGACDDEDPIIPSAPEVSALSLESSGTPVVEIDGATVTGNVEVDEGAETDPLDVFAFDDEGEEIDLAGYYLSAEIEDEDVASFDAEAETDFRGTIEGLVAGETTMTFRITTASGGAGTEIYESPAITIVVN